MRALAVLLVLSGCASVPEVKPVAEDARDALYTTVMIAKQIEDIAIAVCEIDRGSAPCRFLVQALDSFYRVAVVVEDALNRGEDVDEAIVGLEVMIRQLLAQALQIKRSIV